MLHCLAVLWRHAAAAAVLQSPFGLCTECTASDGLALVSMQPAHGQLQLLSSMKLLRSPANEWHVLRCRRPLPKWEFRDYLGWQEQGDGKLAYGVFVQNGRLKGEMKKALRQVGSGFRAAAHLRFAAAGVCWRPAHSTMGWPLVLGVRSLHGG